MEKGTWQSLPRQYDTVEHMSSDASMCLKPEVYRKQQGAVEHTSSKAEVDCLAEGSSKHHEVVLQHHSWGSVVKFSSDKLGCKRPTASDSTSICLLLALDPVIN